MGWIDAKSSNAFRFSADSWLPAVIAFIMDTTGDTVGDAVTDVAILGAAIVVGVVADVGGVFTDIVGGVDAAPVPVTVTVTSVRGVFGEGEVAAYEALD